MLHFYRCERPLAVVFAFCLIAVAVGAPCFDASAAVLWWRGGTGTWHDHNKWGPSNRVPQFGDSVDIGPFGGLPRVEAGQTAMASDVNIFNGSSLNLEFNSTLSVSSHLSVGYNGTAGSLGFFQGGTRSRVRANQTTVQYGGTIQNGNALHEPYNNWDDSHLFVRSGGLYRLYTASAELRTKKIEVDKFGSGGSTFSFELGTLVTDIIEVYAGGTARINPSFTYYGSLDLLGGDLILGYGISLQSGATFDWADGDIYPGLGGVTPVLTSTAGSSINAIAPTIGIAVQVNGGVVDLDSDASQRTATVAAGGTLALNNGTLAGHALFIEDGGTFSLSAGTMSMPMISAAGTIAASSNWSYDGQLTAHDGATIVLQDFDLSEGAGLKVESGAQVNTGLLQLAADSEIWATGGTLSTSIVNLNSGSKIRWQGGILNADWVIINSGAEVTFDNSGFAPSSIIVNGGLLNADLAEWEVDGTVGVLTDGGIRANSITLLNGARMVLDLSYEPNIYVDSIRIDEGAELQLNDYWLYNSDLIVNGSLIGDNMLALGSSAILSGHGNIVGAVSNTSGTIAPGDAAVGADATGRLSVLGLVINSSYGGTIEIEIGGTSDGDYDQILVFDPDKEDENPWDGQAAFGGTLLVSLVDNWMPEVDDVFDILIYDTRLNNSTFSTIILPILDAGLEWAAPIYDYDFDENDALSLRLSVIATGGGMSIPEPSTMSIACFVFVFACCRRRQGQARELTRSAVRASCS